MPLDVRTDDRISSIRPDTVTGPPATRTLSTSLVAGTPCGAGVRRSGARFSRNALPRERCDSRGHCQDKRARATIPPEPIGQSLQTTTVSASHHSIRSLAPHRFNLSHRDIEDLLAERGIEVSYESVRLWCPKLGPLFSKRLRRKHPGFGDTFFIDEVSSQISWRKPLEDRDG